MDYKKSWFLGLLILCVVAVSPFSLAKDPKAKADVEPGNYLRWNKTALGDTYPADGPIVEVYAKGTSDQYSLVGGQTKVRKAAVDYRASCNDCSSCSKSVLVEGGPAYPDTKKSKKGKSILLDVPYSVLSGLDPIEACNQAATVISAKKNLTVAQVVKQGFAVRVDNGLKAAAVTSCKYSKGGFKVDPKVKKDEALLDAWVVCNPNPDAGSKPAKRPVARSTTKTRAADAPTPSARTATVPVPVRSAELKRESD